MEMQNQKSKHGGSTFGRIYKRRARVSTAYQLEQDYFAENSTYLDADFRSFYRMSKKLFLRIIADVEKRDQYFVQKNDAIGRPGLTSRSRGGVTFLTMMMRMIFDCKGMELDDATTGMGT
ncbi:hypothetical protein IFM89_035882 [Coptis chinensis]|uniref:Uncharacterized protein n=1 Tax=Coptis chinensis TaxID=261450 RepID=A0A835H000_9MAGN|nr:hypothetical protein IFM89_035882 [Coptis chinensis]